MNRARFILFYIYMLVGLCVSAQTNDRDCIRMGNSLYKQGQFSKAATMYMKAIDKKPSMEAYYNLGNALAMQGQDSTAYERYNDAVKMSGANNLKKAKLFHNMGNLQYASKNYDLAVQLYKSSLRCNPYDNETRYNLAKALQEMKKNQNNKGSGSGNGNDKDNQNNDKNGKDDKQEQNQNNAQNQNDQKKNDEQKKNNPESNMSESAAEQLLNSAQQDEKNVQEKINERKKRQEQAGTRKLEKDW